MVKTRKFVEGDSTLATKAIWDDELTLIFCELCVNEVNADENSNENECIPSNEVLSNPSHEIPNRRTETLGVVHGKGKKSSSSRKSSRNSLATNIKKLCESMASLRKSVNEIIFPHSQYTISNAMDALRDLGDEIPKKDEMYYFAIKMFQIPVKREVFLNLDPDVRVLVASTESNSNAAERFQRSGETVTQFFTDMLYIFARMGIDTIKLTEDQFEEVPNHIRHDT
ncbi:hypothetical protein PVK06_020289 [Gossypium arboreum]|uniref:Uncharacterized protein n=1 Tax=Gossypium arboreum TaxID=29729 RepID=A0ABR0PLZ8_GOSAR|nr:hypothetical protein PVK06_020289 [Gossypium arboreum]